MNTATNTSAASFATSTLVASAREFFAGGVMDTYLMRAEDGALSAHTIHRMDGGCFLKSDPWPLAEAPAWALPQLEELAAAA